MTITTNQEPEITIKSLGELVLWNEEIFSWMCSKSLPGKNPQTLEEFYEEIGFVPDFYSVHLMELDKVETQFLLFSKILESQGAVLSKMVCINSEKEYSKETKSTISNYINSSISGRFAKVLNRTDRLSQTAVNVELFFQTKMARMIESSLQRLIKRGKK